MKNVFSHPFSRTINESNWFLHILIVGSAKKVRKMWFYDWRLSIRSHWHQILESSIIYFFFYIQEVTNESLLMGSYRLFYRLVLAVLERVRKWESGGVRDWKSERVREWESERVREWKRERVEELEAERVKEWRSERVREKGEWYRI